jgi:hypothetical protein
MGAGSNGREEARVFVGFPGQAANDGKATFAELRAASFSHTHRFRKSSKAKGVRNGPLFDDSLVERYCTAFQSCSDMRGMTLTATLAETEP